jgi:hypothetical protein
VWRRVIAKVHADRDTVEIGDNWDGGRTLHTGLQA